MGRSPYKGYCSTCRKRRVKCGKWAGVAERDLATATTALALTFCADRAQPQCARCLTSGHSCGGYETGLHIKSYGILLDIFVDIPGISEELAQANVELTQGRRLALLLDPRSHGGRLAAWRETWQSLRPGIAYEVDGGLDTSGQRPGPMRDLLSKTIGLPRMAEALEMVCYDAAVIYLMEIQALLGGEPGGFANNDPCAPRPGRSRPAAGGGAPLLPFHQLAISPSLPSRL
jgi:hypothetical protein